MDALQTVNPLSPFIRAIAMQNARKALPAYTEHKLAGNRAEFAISRDGVIRFLKRKWRRELDNRVIRKLWGFDSDHGAARSACSEHDNPSCQTLFPANECQSSDHTSPWPLEGRPDFQSEF